MVFSSLISYANMGWSPIEGPENPIEIFVPSIVSAWSEYEIVVNVNDEDVKNYATYIDISGLSGYIKSVEGAEPTDEMDIFTYKGADTIRFHMLTEELTLGGRIQIDENTSSAIFEMYF